jgi:hypothetical protein
MVIGGAAAPLLSLISSILSMMCGGDFFSSRGCADMMVRALRMGGKEM